MATKEEIEKKGHLKIVSGQACNWIGRKSVEYPDKVITLGDFVDINGLLSKSGWSKTGVILTLEDGSEVILSHSKIYDNFFGDNRGKPLFPK